MAGGTPELDLLTESIVGTVKNKLGISLSRASAQQWIGAGVTDSDDVVLFLSRGLTEQTVQGFQLLEETSVADVVTLVEAGITAFEYEQWLHNGVPGPDVAQNIVHLSKDRYMFAGEFGALSKLIGDTNPEVVVTARQHLRTSARGYGSSTGSAGYAATINNARLIRKAAVEVFREESPRILRNWHFPLHTTRSCAMNQQLKRDIISLEDGDLRTVLQLSEEHLGEEGAETDPTAGVKVIEAYVELFSP